MIIIIQKGCLAEITERGGASGLKLLNRIYQSEYLKEKHSFIFFGDVETPDLIEGALDRRIHDHFIEDKTFILLKLNLMSITDYWLRSTHPQVN